jgi:hypothetical protein
MKNQKYANILLDSSQTWKRRPSEIRGYQKATYMTTDEGDYLRIDFNLRDKRVRLYMEIESEGGNAYYAVISNGSITAEKSVSTGRSFGFDDKFHKRAVLFASIPNKEVLRLINGNYGIKKGRAAEEKARSEKEKRIEETKRRYFRGEGYQGEGISGEEGGRLFKRIGLIDLIDFLIGLLISGSAFLLFNYSFLAMGSAAAFFGIIIGFIDMFFRGRSPVFTKVVFFVLAGAIIYIYGYFF